MQSAGSWFWFKYWTWHSRLCLYPQGCVFVHSCYNCKELWALIWQASHPTVTQEAFDSHAVIEAIQKDAKTSLTSEVRLDSLRSNSPTCPRPAPCPLMSGAKMTSQDGHSGFFSIHSHNVARTFWCIYVDKLALPNFWQRNAKMYLCSAVKAWVGREEGIWLR